MKNIFLFLLLSFLLSCVKEEIPIYEEIIFEEPQKPEWFNVCAFDLSVKEGEFTFINTWEYAGYWDSELRHMDNGTCLGRHASFYFSGEDPENPPKMILEILPKSTDPFQKLCENELGFTAYGLLSKVTGCYFVDKPLLKMGIEDIEHYNPGSGITLEEAHADQIFFDGLKNASRFEFKSNKLIVTTSGGPTARMVFVAVED